MVVLSDLIYPRLRLFSFGMFSDYFLSFHILGPVRLYFFMFPLSWGVSRHSKCLPLCHLQSALVFEQVAINNASELNFNEDEAPAIRGVRLH